MGFVEPKIRLATLQETSNGYVYQTHVGEPRREKPAYVKMLDIIKAEQNGKVLSSENDRSYDPSI